MGTALQFVRLASLALRGGLRLPLWLVLFVNPAKRPCPRWGYIRAIRLKLYHWLYEHGLASGHLDWFIWQPPRGLSDLSQPANIGKPNSRKDGAIVVPPAPVERVGQELEDIAKRNGVSVGDQPVLGYWYGARSPDGRVGLPAAEDEHVILDFHGGGFVKETAAAAGLATIWMHRTRKKSKLISRMFIPEYRLSVRPAATQEPRNPFPTALLDCLASYLYLLDLGFKPQNIIVGGDSAGANLALSLAHLLPTVGLAVPGHFLLLSPAVDGALSHSGPTASATTNFATDYAVWFFEKRVMIDAYRGDGISAEDAATNMWISAGGRDVPATHAAGWFAGLRQSRTLILAGGAESALDGMRTLRDRISADLGDDKEERLVWHEEPDATHDWPNVTFWEPEGEQTIDLIVRFIEGS